MTVYRLVSQNTYEQQLFETASRKYGLDEAILGFGAGEARRGTAAGWAAAAAAAARLLVR